MSQSLRSRHSKGPNQHQTQLYDKVTKIETRILDQLSLLKKNKKCLECKHLQDTPQKCEEFDNSVNYYSRFWKTFLTNEISHKRVQDFEDYLDHYEEKIEQVEELLEKHEQLTGVQARKKARRPAEEIEKSRECPYPKCFKTYGSEVSLNLHIKLKHNGGNKTDREKAAELIWQAKQRGRPIPQFYINLPPHFIEQYGRMTQRIQDSLQEEGQQQ